MIGSMSKGMQIYHSKKELDKQCKIHNLHRKAEEAFVSSFLPAIPGTFAKTLHTIDKQVPEFAYGQNERVALDATRPNGQ
jgi:hypothetical protein